MRIIYLCALLALFISCDETWYYEYVVINNTNYDVSVEAFDTDFPDTLIKESFQIGPKGHYSVFKALGFQGENQGVFKNEEIDSVIIKFDNQRRIIQNCDFQYGESCQFNRNIMDYNNRQDFIETKTGKSSGHQQYSFTYTITEEDYNNALPIMN